MATQLKLQQGGNSIEVSEKAFGREFNEALVHQVVTPYLAGGRSGTSSAGAPSACTSLASARTGSLASACSADSGPCTPSATAASGGRSRSKRPAHSAAAYGASAADVPPPAISTLPPPVMQPSSA